MDLLVQHDHEIKKVTTWVGDPTQVRHRYLLVEIIQGFLETVGVGTLRFGQSLEPVGDFIEAFIASGFCHAWIHVGVFVGDWDWESQDSM